MGIRIKNLLLLAVMFVCGTQGVMKVNLAELLHNRHALAQAEHKRASSKTVTRPHPDSLNHENMVHGNPCIDFPDHPFPCKNTDQCLPFRYICDKSFDCDDGSDEETEMCTASKRPPVDEIKSFLEREKSWLLPTVFPGKTTHDVAAALAVSPTINEFMEKMEWGHDEVGGFVDLLIAIHGNQDDKLQRMGMPLQDWPEVNYMFKNLMESGLDIY